MWWEGGTELFRLEKARDPLDPSYETEETEIFIHAPYKFAPKDSCQMYGK